jgi:mannitol-1-phosphate 5-dehydrogenase
MPSGRRESARARVRFLNTVIGKMSGFAADPARSRLATVTPRSARAFLVESFNRILVSRARFAEPFARGLDVFVEKDDLLPFEEAKLFGHNATHALTAYLAMLLGIERMADLRGVPGFVPFLRSAFIDESGAALIRKHRGVDELFTLDGYRAYADDLLERMTNPFLMDTVERVARDPVRKLGWDDRLVGTMRLAWSHGIEPRRYAIGAAAALAALDGRFLDGGVSAAELAAHIWAAAVPQPGERAAVLALIEQGQRFLADWRESGRGSLGEASMNQ